MTELIIPFNFDASVSIHTATGMRSLRTSICNRICFFCPQICFGEINRKITILWSRFFFFFRLFVLSWGKEKFSSDVVRHSTSRRPGPLSLLIGDSSKFRRQVHHTKLNFCWRRRPEKRSNLCKRMET